MWHAASQLIIQCCTIKTKPIKYATHPISPLTVKSAHPGDNISNSAAGLAFPPFFLSFHIFSISLALHLHCSSDITVAKHLMWAVITFEMYVGLRYPLQMAVFQQQLCTTNFNSYIFIHLVTLLTDLCVFDIYTSDPLTQSDGKQSVGHHQVLKCKFWMSFKYRVHKYTMYFTLTAGLLATLWFLLTDSGSHGLFWIE